mgnify:FL=1
MRTMKSHYAAVFTTEIATIGLQFEESKLTRIDYLTNQVSKAPGSKLVANVKSKIETYLKTPSETKDIKIDYVLNVTAFQGEVLKQLQKIPCGETRTYGEIAKILKTSPRAVGNACRNNPLPIIIPCHRVVAAKGIGGYDGATSGGLLSIKRMLLGSEGVYL